MKKLILMGCFFTLIAFNSCRKSTADATISEALVIGFRNELCLCCPGTLVKIGNDTLQFEQYPPNSPKISPVYPFRVNMEWQRDTSACGRFNSKLIIVSKIEFL
jgi:hypothetical protein